MHFTSFFTFVVTLSPVHIDLPVRQLKGEVGRFLGKKGRWGFIQQMIAIKSYVLNIFLFIDRQRSCFKIRR